MLTFSISLCAFRIPMLFPQVFFFQCFQLPASRLFFSPRVYMFALEKGGNEGESSSELTFQRPTLLYPKLCLSQALKCDIGTEYLFIAAFKVFFQLHFCLPA